MSTASWEVLRIRAAYAAGGPPIGEYPVRGQVPEYRTDLGRTGCIMFTMTSTEPAISGRDKEY